MYYEDGTEEVVGAGEIHYWPFGHAVVVEEAVRMVEFSPHDQVSQVLAHVVDRAEREELVALLDDEAPELREVMNTVKDATSQVENATKEIESGVTGLLKEVPNSSEPAPGPEKPRLVREE